MITFQTIIASSSPKYDQVAEVIRISSKLNSLIPYNKRQVIYETKDLSYMKPKSWEQWYKCTLHSGAYIFVADNQNCQNKPFQQSLHCSLVHCPLRHHWHLCIHSLSQFLPDNNNQIRLANHKSHQQSTRIQQRKVSFI